eukprot:scaffold1975_cov29-Tisochrysis_lutea.AAC.4
MLNGAPVARYRALTEATVLTPSYTVRTTLILTAGRSFFAQGAMGQLCGHGAASVKGCEYAHSLLTCSTATHSCLI